jgi:4a-hydroxytetrahydrobiopterin dehydratase
MVDKLEGSAREAALARVPLWQPVPGRDAIRRAFIFPDFTAAFGFMARVAIMAERMDHHPEWLNVYNRVEVTLSTHDARGFTMLDIEMAEYMDGLKN